MSPTRYVCLSHFTEEKSGFQKLLWKPILVITEKTQIEPMSIWLLGPNSKQHIKSPSVCWCISSHHTPLLSWRVSKNFILYKNKIVAMSSNINKLLGGIMNVEIYASSRRSTNTLRKTDIAIIVMIENFLPFTECFRMYKAHSEDCGRVGKAGNKGGQTHTDLIPRPSTS